MDGSIVFARWANVHQSNTCFLGPSGVHNPNGISIGSAVFAQLSAQSPYTLEWAALFPLKIAPRMGDLDPPSLNPHKSSTQTAS